MTRDWRNRSLSQFALVGPRPSSPPSRRRKLRGRDGRSQENLFPLTADPAQGREIGRPFCILLAAEFVEIIPAVEAGVVSVVENDARRVIAHWLDGSDFDASFAGHGLFLGRGMALYFGAGGFHAKIFGRERKALAAVEADRQY